MYEYTDEAIALLNKRYVRLFGRLKSITSFDELNVLAEVNKLFKELEELTIEVYLKLAWAVYREIADKDPDDIDETWLLLFFREYDPITKYVYEHEVERKKGRLVEAMIAAPDKAAEVKTAMRIWSRQTTQAALEITDRAALKALHDLGVLEVVWITEEDSKVCPICQERDHRVYPINDVPDKPHYNCRCILRPVGGGENWPYKRIKYPRM